MLKYNLQRPKVSFEFFPPKNEEMEKKLWHSISKLAYLAPDFVSVTYGAGGSTRERTHATVSKILKETNLKPVAHLTCVGSTESEIAEIANDYWKMGVRHIVALRGDLPAGYNFTGGYQYAADLVLALKKLHDFEIFVAAYPEIHPEAISADDDLDNLKRKIDNGATHAITQFFFDNDVYFRFIDKARAKGINVPIIPGILPVTNCNQLKNFAASCGAHIPKWMEQLFNGLDDDPEKRNLIAAIVAVDQCTDLALRGVDDFHFYTLNRPELTIAICHILGLR